MWTIATIATIAILSLIVLVLVGMAWYKRLVLQRAFPLEYVRILRRHVPEYSALPTDLQLQLKRKIKVFLFQKKFVACGGLLLTDEMRLTIAGRACLLLLNRDGDVYPRLTHILVYPNQFRVPRQIIGEDGVVAHEAQALSGESWEDGRVILAWDQVISSDNLAQGQDLVLHEFAHQLDSEDGSSNGAPSLPSKAAYQVWSGVMQTEYERLLNNLEQGQTSVIDSYGATNPAEFFAVVTEAFFRKTSALAICHPQLFDLLRQYYRVDPRDWRRWRQV